MPLTTEIRLQVRRRAAFACEYCGVSEAEAGGELTIDHFQPQSRGGTDHPDNLVYCCFRCNQYKGDYWPQRPDDAPLWNPRHETSQTHFELLADGALSTLTPTGEATLRRLQLNRPQLVIHRLQARYADAQTYLVDRYRQLTQDALRLLLRQSTIIREQNALLRREQERPDQSNLPPEESLEENIDE